jgi:aminoglycoside 3-N-acetyltransferase
MTETPKTTLERLIDGLGDGPLLVHSDLLRAGRLLPVSAGRNEWLTAHVDLVREIAGERGLWMPAFNYGFPRSGSYDVLSDVSEVGPLTEHFRTTVARWRTPTPVFSFAGRRPEFDRVGQIDPFGPRSPFARLVEQDGAILFYGAPFSAATIIHHVERSAGGPLYRYDKRFPGEVIGADRMVQRILLLYHVRPLNRWLDYDWEKLLLDSISAGVCRAWESNGSRFIAASARGLVRLWTERLGRNPLYLLDEQSRNWVEPMLERLGRRFEIDDFEGSVVAEASCPYRGW